MTLPNFVVIGAAKCGTDALCKFLAQHPEIYMSPIREPNFFVAEGVSEVPYRGPGDRAAFEDTGMWVWTLDDYERLFEGVAGERAVGEGTAWYIYFEEAGQRIRRHIADVRLIAMLRNPVDRAYSAYTMLLGNGRETLYDFAQAVAAEPKRTELNWDPLYRYVDMGFYARQLRRYFRIFDRDQFKIVIYDDFNARPTETMRDIFRFLEVADGFVPETSERHNVSAVPRNRALHRLVAGHYPMKEALKFVIPTELRQSLKRSVMAPNLTRPAPLGPNVRRTLVEVFREDVLDLQDLLGRDLTAWLR